MHKATLSFFIGAVFFVTLFSVSLNVASARVTVYDSVTASNRAVQLKALTKGRFFPEGGKLVKFYLDGRHIGTTLSGGDGYAFLEYLPLFSGIKHIKVKGDVDTDEGILLITGKNDKVLLIEIESTLFVLKLQDLLKPGNPVRKGSKDALDGLSKRFRIIYLTTMIGVKKSKEWLKNNEFPPSTVLKWEGINLLDELQEIGVRLYAIIGSPDMLAEASDIKKRFSFKETEDGEVVKDWNELLKRLK